jgi:DNA-binding protein HU-beta
MKKSDLVAEVAEKAELSKAAATRAIHALFDGTTGAIARAVRAGEQVSIPGFGRFRPKTRKARKGRNPQTGAEIEIPERNTVQFSVGRDLKSSVGGQGTATKKGTTKKPAGAKKGMAAGAATKSKASKPKAAASTARAGAARASSATGRASTTAESKRAAKSAAKAPAKPAAKSAGKAAAKPAAKGTAKAPAKSSTRSAAKPAGKTAAKGAAKPATSRARAGGAKK